VGEDDENEDLKQEGGEFGLEEIGFVMRGGHLVQGEQDCPAIVVARHTAAAGLRVRMLKNRSYIT
jgi:hypothetical protein